MIQILKKVKIVKEINLFPLEMQKGGIGAFAAVMKLVYRVLPVKFFVVK